MLMRRRSVTSRRLPGCWSDRNWPVIAWNGVLRLAWATFIGLSASLRSQPKHSNMPFPFHVPAPCFATVSQASIVASEKRRTNRGALMTHREVSKRHSSCSPSQRSARIELKLLALPMLWPGCFSCRGKLSRPGKHAKSACGWPSP